MLAKPWSLVLLSSGLLSSGLLSACITPKPVDSDDSGETGGETGSSGTTIFDVNDGTVPVGTSVTLDRVVVSSPKTFGDEGFFIQDPAGGANSGLYVWSYKGVKDIYVEPGDELSVTGSVSDYYGWIEFTVDSADAVVNTGTADIPAPAELGDGSGVNWDEYESVPVTLTGQTVDSVNSYGTGYLAPSDIGLDNGFVNADFACRGEFASVTGVIFYSYEEWSLNPRTEADIGGYTDGPTLDATVSDVQHGKVCGPVALHDLVVTSPAWDDDGEGYFFAQDEGGGAYSGITVYLPGGKIDVSVGDTVDVAGVTSEFYDLTEVRVHDASGVVVTGSGEPVVDVLGTAPKDWEPWESCLVEIGPVGQECADPADNYGQCLVDWAISMDNVFYDYPWEEAVGYDRVVGPVFYAYATWLIEPRSAEDVEQE